ncbi:hypothetical protein BJ912DRAFT_969669 [Pholiota molesta]|nr:hypothetical protein BJ912DRAFT_969669 [Pholiota molesta]
MSTVRRILCCGWGRARSRTRTRRRDWRCAWARVRRAGVRWSIPVRLHACAQALRTYALPRRRRGARRAAQGPAARAPGGSPAARAGTWSLDAPLWLASAIRIPHRVQLLRVVLQVLRPRRLSLRGVVQMPRRVEEGRPVRTVSRMGVRHARVAGHYLLTSFRHNLLRYPHCNSLDNSRSATTNTLKMVAIHPPCLVWTSASLFPESTEDSHATTNALKIAICPLLGLEFCVTFSSPMGRPWAWDDGESLWVRTRRPRVVPLGAGWSHPRRT